MVIIRYFQNQVIDAYGLAEIVLPGNDFVCSLCCFVSNSSRFSSSAEIWPLIIANRFKIFAGLEGTIFIQKIVYYSTFYYAIQEG